MRSAATKTELENLLNSRFDAGAGIREHVEPERFFSGIPEVDGVLGGLARGALTEVCGGPSSGRTSFALSLLAGATSRPETCAFVDAADALDPASAARAGVDLDRLLWVRCGGCAGRAMQAADLLVRTGGFGVIVLDIAQIPPRIARHIPLVSWFRLRRAIENTPTVLLVVSAEPQAKSAASVLLEMNRREAQWSGAPGVSQLLRGARVQARPRKPPRPVCAGWEIRALG